MTWYDVSILNMKNLNEEQKKAVLHRNGPLLILAGAGAGKTRVITHRILNLVHNGVSPENILAVTFTNKAAKEMRGRVLELLQSRNSHENIEKRRGVPFISTFHALGVQILRSNSQILGLPRSFTIFDRNDSIRAIKEATKIVGVDPKQFEPRKILSSISRAKGNALTLESYEKNNSGFYPRTIISVWKEYEKILFNEKALDFDDLLLKTLNLLIKNENIRNHYRSLWQYIHIDEYQDTNLVQCRIAHTLTAPKNNICVVGDIDQNIYSWRGANIDNILAFEKKYPKTTTLLLEQNYRSTKTILEVSNTIIQKNKQRKEKKLFTDNPKGEKVALVSVYDENAEAIFIAKQSLKEISAGTSAKDITVLYRANFQSRALEEAFLANEVPYQVLGVRFFERKEVKDILSFIRVAINPESLSDIKRIVNVPPRGIGKVTLLKITTHREDLLSPRAKKNVAEFQNLLTQIRECAQTQPISKTILFVLKKSGLEEVLRKGTSDEQERLENIHELVTLAMRYDTLTPEEGVEKLLEDAALATDQDEIKEEKDAVKLMTVHASKGLEFDTVFITGLEEGLFPHKKISAERIDEEEERRLFYVALTRAKKKLFLTYTSIRTIFGSRKINIPSEFITDIDDVYTETIEWSGEESGSVVYID